MAVGIGLLAMTDDPVAFLIVLILTGLANGFVPAGQALVATSTPRTRVGGALALTQAGASVGTLVGPIIGAALIGMMPTMHSLFTVTSVAMFCAALLVLLVVREVHVRPQHALRIELRADLRQIMRVPDLKLLYFLEVLFASTVFGAMPIISLYTMHLIDQQPGFMGLKTETWLAITAMTFTIASIAVLPFWGRVLNRVEPQRVLKILLAGTCLTSVLIPLVRDPLELVIARVLFALFVSGLPATLIRMIRDRAPQGMEARTLSYGTAIQQLGSATAPLIAGVLAPYVGLRGFFGFASVLVLVAWVLWIRRGHAFRTRG
jgi:DHA1 family multidrug resistance protein-like MFS transporter